MLKFTTSVFAAALAGSLAIATMFALRCLHPPGGAVALTAVLGGPAIHAAGYAFVWMPVGLNSLLLVIGAIVFNNLTGRRYPHAAQLNQNVHATRDSVPTERLGFTPADLDAVLHHHNQVLDVSRDDLEALFLQTEMRAYRRRFGVITCANVMSKDVISADFATELGEAWSTMRQHRITALPVLNRAKRVIGIVTESDFLEHGGLDDYRTMRQKLRRFLLRTGASHSDKAEVVGQIMTPHPKTATVGTPIIDLVSLMANSGLQHIPIVDAQGRLAGIVTQSDMVAALYQSRFTEGAGQAA